MHARMQKHIVNSLNDSTYYVNLNFNFYLHNNNLFQIYMKSSFPKRDKRQI